MDIIERLRIKWSAMGDMANAERAEAVDEIERLRRKVNSLMTAIYEAGDLLDAGQLIDASNRLDEAKFNHNMEK